MTLRSVTATAIATAMLATSVTPAMAQGYPGGGYGNPGWNSGWNNGRRHHRDRGISAGDVIAGVAVIGVIAAIASAASKSNTRNRDYGNINSDDQAAEVCATSAEQRLGNGARVTGIDSVYRTRDGYGVRGTINGRYARDDRYGNDRGDGFSCTVRYGRVEDVRLDNGYAYRGY